MTDVAINPVDNPVLDKAESAFKQLVWDVYVKVVIARLLVLVPFLSAGPFAAVISFFVMKITDMLFSALALSVAFEAIQLKNALHQKAVDEASLKLKVILLDEGNQSDAYKKALADAQSALSTFVRFGG